MFAFRIQRYILREILVPMGLGLFIFTFVLLMGRSQHLMELVVNKGVAVGELGGLILSLLPAFFVLTIPVAFLLGVLLAFGRLSAESELVALKACGVRLATLMQPVLLLGAGACVILAGLTLYLEPSGNTSFRQQVFQIAKNRATVGIRPLVFNDFFDGFVLYASQVDDQSGLLHDVFISDERPNAMPVTIFADSGKIEANSEDQSLYLRLNEGTIHSRSEEDQETVYQTIRFGTYTLKLDFAQNTTDPKRKKLRESDLTIDKLLSAREQARNVEEYRVLTAGLHKRFIFATTPLLFALVGVPLSLGSHRSGRGVGFALALGIFLAFYVLLSLAKTLVVQGGWPIFIIWLPVLVFLGLGLTLLQRAASERPLTLRLPDFFRKRNSAD